MADLGIEGKIQPQFVYLRHLVPECALHPSKHLNQLLEHQLAKINVFYFFTVTKLV